METLAVPLEIIATTTWSTLVRVAEHYRGGRVCLVGDAAHVLPPRGGFGGSTGLADAHNLASKLATVLEGRAGSELLDTCGAERQPAGRRGGERARLRTDFDARFQIRTPRNQEIFTQLLDVSAVLMRSPYPPRPSSRRGRNPAGGAADGAGGHPLSARLARQGRRAPVHARPVRGAPVLLVGPDASGAQLADTPPWAGSARTVRPGRDVLLEASGGLQDGAQDWAQLTGLPGDGALLVRPDGFVQQRSDAAHPSP